MCLAVRSKSPGCSLLEIEIAPAGSIVVVYLLMYLKAVSDAFFLVLYQCELDPIGWKSSQNHCERSGGEPFTKWPVVPV
jgi:hypothetical protein